MDNWKVNSHIRLAHPTRDPNDFGIMWILIEVSFYLSRVGFEHCGKNFIFIDSKNVPFWILENFKMATGVDLPRLIQSNELTHPNVGNFLQLYVRPNSDPIRNELRHAIENFTEDARITLMIGYMDHSAAMLLKLKSMHVN